MAPDMASQDTQVATLHRFEPIGPQRVKRSLELEPREEDLSGSSLGAFELLGPIERGGMAMVYAARQMPLRRTVAIKILRYHRNEDPRSIKCFEREAVAAARLTHPGIARLYAAGVAGGRHFLAMELIDGCSLEDRIAAWSRDARAPWIDPRSHDLDAERCRAATHLAAAIGDALQHAHENGVVHCDVNPRNILLDQQNQPRLVDFGLARIDGDNSDFADTVAGTLLYMSPEQLLGGCVDVDHRTDIFSLGVLLYELLTLHRPFQGVSNKDLLFDLAFREPLPVRHLNPAVSPAMQRVCHRAIAKNPEARFRDMAGFVNALRACPPGGESCKRS